MYEILPQDIKRRERKELKKIDKFEAKNSLSLHYSRVHQNGPFYIEFMAYMGTFHCNLTHQTWVTTSHIDIYKLEASCAPIT